MTAAENKRADNSRPKATGYRLCVYASGSLITVVFCCSILIIVSCLHFGQNNGKFLSTVSLRIQCTNFLIFGRKKERSLLAAQAVIRVSLRLFSFQGTHAPPGLYCYRPWCGKEVLKSSLHSLPHKKSQS